MLASPRRSTPRTSEMIPAAELPAFQSRLLAWFAGAKRDLDWRRTSDPYQVWISEIMLQQTRVATVLPYYRRFLTQFPSVDALARARPDVVLRYWAGLGYYSRARNLHRAAKEIVARHEGNFPKGLEEALALPGIGNYTAAAVLSIAYGEPHAVLDGNVARVLARLGTIRGELRQPITWRKLADAANALLPAHGTHDAASGDWNQAMMELGATLCTPRAPQCGACPVARWCRAHALGIAGALPSARKKRQPISLALSAAVLLDARGRTLVLRQKSDHSVLFSSLWQFPAIEASKPDARKLARHLKSAFGISADLQPLPPARHTVTFRKILLAPFLVRVRQLPASKLLNSKILTKGSVRKPVLSELERLPISSATQKIAAAALGALAAR